MKIYFLLLFIWVLPKDSQRKNEIVGEWQVNWNLTFNRASQDKQNNYKASDLETQNMIEDVIASKIYVFKDNGSFFLSWKNSVANERLSGSWSWEENQKNLRLTIGNSTREYSVSILKFGTIVLKPKAVSNAIIFDEIVLVKNN